MNKVLQLDDYRTPKLERIKLSLVEPVRCQKCGYDFNVVKECNYPLCFKYEDKEQ